MLLRACNLSSESDRRLNVRISSLNEVSPRRPLSLALQSARKPSARTDTCNTNPVVNHILGACSRLFYPSYFNPNIQMKVLQTIGRHGGHQEGIFQYKRGASGVTVDASIGQAQLDPNTILITTEEWTAILQAIQNCSQATFRLSGSNQSNPPPPNQVLYDVVSRAVPNPADNWSWNDSWRAYVAAILEHEGSIDLYHGVLGQQHGAFIPLARDIP